MSNYISKYLNSIRKQYLYINSCNILQIYLYPQRWVQPQSYRVMGAWVTGITGLYNSRVIRSQPLAGFRDTTPELQSYGLQGVIQFQGYKRNHRVTELCYRDYRVIQLQGYISEPCKASDL